MKLRRASNGLAMAQKKNAVRFTSRFSAADAKMGRSSGTLWVFSASKIHTIPEDFGKSGRHPK